MTVVLVTFYFKRTNSFNCFDKMGKKIYLSEDFIPVKVNMTLKRQKNTCFKEFCFKFRSYRALKHSDFNSGFGNRRK